MSEFFLELFSEEIPTNLQKSSRTILLKNFQNLFEEMQIGFKKSIAYSSPNRLIILFEGLSKEITQKAEEVRGPNVKAPENAIEGFLRSHKIYDIYAEYGFTEKITGVIYAPVFSRATLNRRVDTNDMLIAEGDELNSVGDIDISFKYTFLQKDALVVSFGLTLGIPTGNPSGGNTQLLQTGDGEFNQLVNLSAGYSFYPVPFYAILDLGVNNRTSNFSDEFRYGVELGYTLKKFTLITRAFGVKSFFNGDENALNGNGLFNNNVEYLSLAPELIFQMNEQLGLSAGFGTAVSGRSILAARTYQIGMFVKL